MQITTTLGKVRCAWGHIPRRAQGVKNMRSRRLSTHQPLWALLPLCLGRHMLSHVPPGSSHLKSGSIRLAASCPCQVRQGCPCQVRRGCRCPFLLTPEIRFADCAQEVKYTLPHVKLHRCHLILQRLRLRRADFHVADLRDLLDMEHGECHAHSVRAHRHVV